LVESTASIIKVVILVCVDAEMFGRKRNMSVIWEIWRKYGQFETSENLRTTRHVNPNETTM